MKLIRPLRIGEIDNIRRVSDAYYRDETGELTRVGPNVARFNYDEAGNFVGMLVEPNPYKSVISESDNFKDDGVWVSEGVTLGDLVEGPDGVANSAMEASGPGYIQVVDSNMGQTSFDVAQPASIRAVQIEVLPEGSTRPFVSGVGPQYARSSGSLSTSAINWPTGYQTGDIGILMVKLIPWGLVNPPPGWTEFAPWGGPLPYEVQYRLYWRRATSDSMPAAEISHRGTQISRIITVRGAKLTGVPFGPYERNDDFEPVTRKIIEGFEATSETSMMLILAQYDLPSATLITSNWRNDSLYNIQLVLDGTGNAVIGRGGFIIATGEFAKGGIIPESDKVRASIFVKHIDGPGTLRVSSQVDSQVEEFDMLNLQSSETKTFELYQEGWYRLTALFDGPYGFKLELDGGDFHIFRANTVATEDYYQPLLNGAPMTGDVALPYVNSQLIYSNIPEPDPRIPLEENAEMWTDAEPYAKDAVVIQDHNVYRSLQDDNSDRPDEGVLKDVPSWSRLATSNHWKMYDMLRGVDVTSVRDNIIDQIIFVPKVARAYALFGISAGTLRITATKDTVPVFDETINLVSLAGNAYWYEYFTNTPTRRSTVVGFNLPPIPGLLVRFTLTGEGPVHLGKLIIGEELSIGCTKWNVRTEFVNTSRQEREEFGNLVLVPRRVYKIRDFDIRYPTDMAEQAEQIIESIINGPTVFVGSAKFPTSIIYGIVKDFRPVLSTPRESLATLKVESI